MNSRWFILLYLLKIHLKLVTAQQHHHHHHHHFYEDTLQQYDDEDDPDMSNDSSAEYTRRTGRTQKNGESEECFCSCAACFFRETPNKPCCNEFCKYCTEPGPQGQYLNQEQKVVFVPFPYPLIVPNQNQNQNQLQNLEMAPTEKPQTTAITTVSTTTKTTTSPTTKATTIKPKSKLRSKSVEVGMLSRHRTMKQLNPEVKRTRPAWVPKYGIVPIPDHLAAKLMTQLTEVRALKAKRL